MNLGDLESMNEIMNWFKESEMWASVDAVFTIVSIFITLGTLIMVVKNYLTNKKQYDKIPIYFNDKKLKLNIARKDFSRQELQGILGILRKEMKKQYEVDFFSKVEYLDSIYKIQKSELDELVIKITKKELEQFKNDIY